MEGALLDYSAIELFLSMTDYTVENLLSLTTRARLLVLRRSILWDTMAKTKSDCSGGARAKVRKIFTGRAILGSRPKYQNQTLEPHSVGILNTDTEPTKHPYLFIYLFNSRRKKAVIHKGYVVKQRKQREKGQLPTHCRATTTKGIRRPPRYAVRKSPGQAYPHIEKKRKEKRQRP